MERRDSDMCEFKTTQYYNVEKIIKTAACEIQDYFLKANV